MTRYSPYIFLRMVIATVLCSNICLGDGSVGESHLSEFVLVDTPHPGVGSFKLQHNPDNPILAYYGGIGLQLDENGAWTDYGIDSTDAIDYLIERCSANGMKRICANIMFQWTPSELLGPIPNTPVPDNAESLYGYAIEQAHKNNIEVYIDIPIFGRRTRDEAFATANPDIYAKSSRGEVREEFFSPAHPKVREYRIAILLEALSLYPADGIMLDFIRWPNYELDLLHSHCNWGYEEVMLDRFRAEYNLPDDFIPEPDDPRFLQARADCVTEFIQELRDAMTDRGIDLPIGVYNSNIYGREAGMRHVCQDWADWERLGLVDQHHPMFYMDSPARLTRALQTLIEVKRPGSTVFGPIFLDGPGPFTDETILDASRRMIKLGADGIWFCREMEIETLALWPTVKRVSELSIREVRATDFDPYHENLAVNGGFDDGIRSWESQPSARVSVIQPDPAGNPTALEIKAAEDAPTVVSQVIKHNPSPVVALRSIGVSCQYQAGYLRAAEPAKVLLNLRYADGTEESHTFLLPVDTTATLGWQSLDRALPVAYSAVRCLESSIVRILCPAGDGTLHIDNLVVTPDPLHNPLNPPTKDESE